MLRCGCIQDEFIEKLTEIVSRLGVRLEEGETKRMLRSPV